MIIDCPSCSTQFRAPDEAAMVPGRKFRCSNCGHLWAVAEAEPDVVIIPGPVAPPPPPPANFTKVLKDAIAREEAALKKLATVKVRRSFWHLSGHGPRGYAAAAATLFIFLLVADIFQGPITKMMPMTVAVYDLFGRGAASTALVIDQVRAVQPENDDRPNMVRIEGRVINLSETEQSIMPIRIRLIGETPDKVLASWVFKPRINLLDREQSADFYSVRPVKDMSAIKQIETRFVVP